MTTFPPPDFDAPPLGAAPEAQFEPAPGHGVLPEGFFATTNLPTYLKRHGRWHLPREPRMDGALVLDKEGELWVKEPRRVRAGEPVAMGLAEDGSAGIYVYAAPFLPAPGEAFGFMQTPVSREKPIAYASMAARLVEERERGGYPLWVTGPALVHARARGDLVWFIENGFVGALLAGNAVAVHDIEAAFYGTSLGMNAQGAMVAGGHSLHLRAINRIRAEGSIERAVQSGMLKEGVLYACVKHKVPYVLCGSIRDDGPLPGVYSDALAAQDAMKAHTTRATLAVLIASALHAIAVGNMLPAYVPEADGSLRVLPTFCVDSSEFVVNKLKDRGTREAVGVVTNAQDYLQLLRLHIERALAGSTPA